MRILACLALLALGSPAALAAETPDFNKPLFTRSGALVCETEEAVAAWYRLHTQGGDAATQHLPCFGASGGLRALVISSHGFLDPQFHVRLVGPGGDVEGWVDASGLRN